MWRLRLPLGSHWTMKLVVQFHLTLGPVKRELRLDLKGEFWMKQLPHESTFIEFMEAHQPPPDPLLSTSPAEWTEWHHKILNDGYAAIEGQASGTLHWTEYGGTFSMYPDVPLFTYTYETLPEKIYPVSAVIRGGYWLDGIRLLVSRNGDPGNPLSEESGWYFERTQKVWHQDGRVQQHVLKGGFNAQWLPEPGSEIMLQYTNTPQTYTPTFAHDVEIVLSCDCPVAPERYVVEAKRVTPGWAPDHSKSRMQVQLLRASLSVSSQPTDGWTQGDIPISQVDITWNGKQSAADPDSSCLWVDKIEVTQVVGIKMYIISEYAVGTCPYNAILEHEMKHAAIYTDTVDEYLEKVKTRLLSEPKIPSKARPVRVTALTVDEEQEKITEVVKEIVLTLYKECLQKIDEQDNALDTPAEYAKVRMKCPDADWI